LILWAPACALFAFVYPAWQLSLQLAVTLAADNVDDLMKDLGPWAAQVRKTAFFLSFPYVCPEPVLAK
jgi:hypothetical protein